MAAPQGRRRLSVDSGAEADAGWDAAFNEFYEQLSLRELANNFRLIRASRVARYAAWVLGAALVHSTLFHHPKGAAVNKGGKAAIDHAYELGYYDQLTGADFGKSLVEWDERLVPPHARNAAEKDDLVRETTLARETPSAAEKDFLDEVLRETLASDPPEAQGLRDEWAQRTGWHRTEKVRR